MAWQTLSSKAGQVAGEFQGAGRAHRMADETLGVVDGGLGAVAENLAQGDALLDVAAIGGRGVRADEVDIAKR